MAQSVEDLLTWAFSPTISAILVTLFISLSLPLLIHWYLYRKAAAKEVPSFILAGPSGTGKTSLLTLFVTGKAAKTHTSQEPNSILCQLPSTTNSREDKYRSEHDTLPREQPTFTLIDTPGHGKLRHHASAAVHSRTSVRGIIFVVDSAALSSTAGLNETAEYLYDILLLLQKRHTQSKTSKVPSSIPVLVAANKQDVFTSLPAGLVKTKLEEEVGRIRSSRSKGLLDSGVGMDDDAGEDEEANWLGEYGAKEFKFGQMEEHGIDIVVAGGSIKGDGEESGAVEEWWSWIGDQL